MKRRKRHSALLTGSILMLVAATFNAEQVAAAELEAARSQELPIIYGTTSETAQKKTYQTLKTPKIIESKGTYTGLADPHTAEIEVDGEPTSFQLEEGVMKKVEAWDSGTPVQLTYSIKTFDNMPGVKQFILHNIEQTK
ncbi:hypothetical protein [Paenibacillus sp. Marseille-Q4541]|uniref:hypothetical protein n=1 Tax=Paenibacillus sp. Marseille-Q4541 TaxID=2831522 RepID=UPI001BAA5B32|nr:hypothetical protein [Paenibacillus sp. Marseille-Q4541]